MAAETPGQKSLLIYDQKVLHLPYRQLLDLPKDQLNDLLFDMMGVPPRSVHARFPLISRNMEDLLFEREIDIYHETVRLRWKRPGPLFAGDIRRQRVNCIRGFRHRRWHLDETYVKLNGEMVYLRRPVDHVGEVLGNYVTRSRD